MDALNDIIRNKQTLFHQVKKIADTSAAGDDATEKLAALQKELAAQGAYIAEKLKHHDGVFAKLGERLDQAESREQELLTRVHQLEDLIRKVCEQVKVVEDAAQSARKK